MSDRKDAVRIDIGTVGRIYVALTHCPQCGTELTWVETSIDDVKDCATSLQHTIDLWAYCEMLAMFDADVARGELIRIDMPVWEVEKTFFEKVADVRAVLDKANEQG